MTPCLGLDIACGFAACSREKRGRSSLVPIERDVTAAPGEAQAAKKARFALIVTLWGIFVSNITLTILTTALPTIAKDLDADRALTNWVSLGPMLVVALLTPAAGRLSDNYGRKRLWVLGSLLAMFGMLGSALSTSIGPLIFARVVTGTGTALMVPAGLAISTSLFPQAERATPIGYWTSTVAISPLLGLVIGGSLLEFTSWRWLFAGQVALGLPPLIAAFVGFDEQRFPVRGRFDWEGSAAVGVASLALMLAATWLGRYGLSDLHVASAVLVSGLACAWAISAEKRADNPVLPPTLLSDPSVVLSLVCRFTLNFSYMGAFLSLPYMLAELWHLTPSGVSLQLVWRPLAMGLTGPFAGRLALRFGASQLVVMGALAIFVSTAAFMALDASPNTWLLVSGLTVAGVGLGLSSPGTVAVVTSRVGAELLGTASGLMTLSATIANALGMAVMFAVVEAAGGVRSASAYRMSFLLGTVVVFVGVLSALRLLKLERTVSERAHDAMGP